MSDYAKQPRRKFCQFCKEDTQYIDYKDTQMLRKYVTDRGKIKPRRVTAGQHEVTISLYRDIKTTVKLFVGGADDEVAPAEAEVVEETIEEVVEAPAEETAEAAE